MISYNFKTYNELFFHIVNNYENSKFLNYLQDGKYVNISIQEFELRVKYLALALNDIGIKKSDNVAIFAKSSPFWLIFDFAIHLLDAISVPIFDNISTKNLEFEIEDSNINYIFTDCSKRIKEINKEVTYITYGFYINRKNTYSLDSLFILGERLYNQNENKDFFDCISADEQSLFSVIYTSGNTGTPKGVELTNENVISQLQDINEIFYLDEKQSALSILPLAHIFERTVMSYYLSKGMSIYFVDDIQNISNLLKIVKPTTMTVVPRLLEKIYSKIQENISAKPILSKTLGILAFRYATYFESKGLIYKIFDKLVYSKFREIFGSRIEQLVCGGAALDKDIYRFFINIKIPLYQGYGLTEFSPVICTNTPNFSKIGSCGKALPSVEVKISEENEILVRGKALMKGYRNQEDLTNKTIINGWLHTGDIGKIDEEGYIFVESRLKDVVKTSTGEYVPTLKIEQALTKNRYIEFATVIANNRKFVSCLIFVNKDFYNQSKTKLTIEEFYNQSYITKSIDKTVQKVNKKLDKAQKVKEYRIITNEISIQTGELTPSMKISKVNIEKKYEQIINQMY
ncbi:long-chain fatty acid--CoA ligase [Arcobacter sp. CECT 8985]|uniref:AMP-dependent synthetase/ligase n=1 Tax=Arcobacter sp. CECT 8985 TaxID=1935424 RepID=UPI00100BE399|nr:AMP-binding protein [Arcobacter sp. CECT 8985]RXJ88169.1 AMP-dependent synthetase [Arcobacter sp. CECT 8985]